MILIIGGSFQGKKAYAAQICKDGRILADFQDRIRAVLEAGEDPEAFTRQLLTDPPAVITLDEVGCGIVPLEKSERDYREAVGLTRLAGTLLGVQDDIPSHHQA